MQWLMISHELKGMDGQDHFKDYMNRIILISFLEKKLCKKKNQEQYIPNYEFFSLHKSL